MSLRLPRISGYEVVKALSKAGWRVIRQKGSHVRMQKEDLFVTVPLHPELDRRDFKKYLEGGRIESRGVYRAALILGLTLIGLAFFNSLGSMTVI